MRFSARIATNVKNAARSTNVFLMSALQIFSRALCEFAEPDLFDSMSNVEWAARFFAPPISSK